MKIKTATLEQFKALDGEGGEPDGTFEAVVSVFGNVDLAGDRVVQGAFAKSLTTWAQSGDPIPVIWSHQWQDPEMHIGGVLQAEERAEGLWVKAQLDVAADPVAAKVWRLLSSRRVREFSFAYDVREEKQQNGANELLELDVIEVGPTLKGMNPDTLLLEAKARRAARAGTTAKSSITAGPAPDAPDEALDDATKAAAAARPGRKAMVTLDGSYEQLQQRLTAAITDWSAAVLPTADIYLAGLEATYADHAVVYVETWSQPWGGGDYFAVPYEVATDGVASLGEPAPLQLIGVAVPKACTDLAAIKKAATPTPVAQPFSDPGSVRAAVDLLELGG